MVRTDLFRLPAGDRHVAFGLFAENLFHRSLGVEYLLFHEIENVRRILPNLPFVFLAPARRSRA